MLRRGASFVSWGTIFCAFLSSWGRALEVPWRVIQVLQFQILTAECGGRACCHSTRPCTWNQKKKQEYNKILFSLKITVKFKSECHWYITQKPQRKRAKVVSLLLCFSFEPFPHIFIFKKDAVSPTRSINTHPSNPPLTYIITPHSVAM
jgi:hypothetical protein